MAAKSKHSMDLRKTVPSQGFTKGAAKESVDTMLWKKGGACNEDLCANLEWRG